MASNEGFPPLPGSGKHKTMAVTQEMANPFKLPSDDQIFRLREEERKSKQRNQNSTKSLLDKTQKNVFSRTERLRELVGEDKITTLNDAIKNEESSKIIMPRRNEKENTAEFVAKKREMFLVQMSLDTKREEIRKLEEKAQMKEEALQRSEQMLEEDAMRFDAFLKDNDKKAHDAIKRAEEETKKKQEKVQEIKRLTQQIQALSSEMSKHKEALEDCLRYKTFLDMLTPPEWFEQHEERHRKKIKDAKEASWQIKKQEWEKLRRKLTENHNKEVEARREAKAKLNRRGRPAEEEDDEPEIKLVIPPSPKLVDEVVDVPKDEVPMYFTEPQQLMNIFSALEEQNLFLIQNSQETERTLEELQHQYAETKITMDSHTGSLQMQIDDLHTQISQEEARVKLLLSKRIAAGDVKAGNEGTGKDKGKEEAAKDSGMQAELEKERLLADLNSKVSYVYEQCGFDASSKPSTLFMLSQMEIKLEHLLKEIERMPQDYVIKAEKEKEKRRRERKREEQQALHIRLQEERNRRAIERSMQAPKKKVGKPVFSRSRPIRSEQRNNNDDNKDDDHNDEMKYLS